MNNLVSYALDHVYVAEETVKAVHYTNDPEEEKGESHERITGV